eukprot:6207742-Pleurochrysis_carterae.AAC.1
MASKERLKHVGNTPHSRSSARHWRIRSRIVETEGDKSRYTEIRYGILRSGHLRQRAMCSTWAAHIKNDYEAG